MPQPGLLQEITGSDVREFTFVSPAEEPVWASFGEREMEMPVFNDILEALPGTETVAVYGNSYYAGAAAMTERKLGRGRAIHLGSVFSREITTWLFEYLGIREPFADLIEAPEGMEVVLRKKEDKKYLFVLNFQAQEMSCLLKKEMKLLYTGEMAQGRQSFSAYGTAVYEVL